MSDRDAVCCSGSNESFSKQELVMAFRKYDNSVITFPSNPAEYRESMERKKAEQEAFKRRVAAALITPNFDAQRRIRLWESVHGLHLPKSPHHQLLKLIARKTDLTVEQIREEQARRRDAANSQQKIETPALLTDNP
jgi:hypothetical protein